MGSSGELPLCASRPPCTLTAAAPVAAGASMVGVGSERVHSASQLVSLFIFCHGAYPLAGQTVRHYVSMCCPALAQPRPRSPQSAWVHDPSSKVVLNCCRSVLRGEEATHAAGRPLRKRYSHVQRNYTGLWQYHFVKSHYCNYFGAEKKSRQLKSHSQSACLLSGLSGLSFL